MVIRGKSARLLSPFTIHYLLFTVYGFIPDLRAGRPSAPRRPPSWPFSSCEGEGGAPVLVPGVHVGAALDEERDALREALVGGGDERGAALRRCAALALAPVGEEHVERRARGRRRRR